VSIFSFCYLFALFDVLGRCDGGGSVDGKVGDGKIMQTQLGDEASVLGCNAFIKRGNVLESCR
jgi:hypothetical protein